MRSLRSALACAALAVATLGIPGCRTPPPEPSLLDKEFEAYRLDRDERRIDDLKARGAKARTEADRLESELAGLMRRIREAKTKLPDARAEAEALPPAPPAAVAAPTPAPSPSPVPGSGAVGAPSATAGPLPPPLHREAAPAPK